MRKIVTVLTVAIAFAAGGVYAAGETGFMPWSNWRNDVWNAYDSNKDGNMSMDEVKEMNHVLGEDFNGFQPWMVDHFAELDENKDGVVDQHELHMMMMAKKWTDKQLVNEWYKNLGFMVTNPANR